MQLRIKKSGAAQQKNVRKDEQPGAVPVAEARGSYDADKAMLEHINRFLETKKNEQLLLDRCNSCSSTSNTLNVFQTAGSSTTSSIAAREAPKRRAGGVKDPYRRSNLQFVEESESESDLNEQPSTNATKRKSVPRSQKEALKKGSPGTTNTKVEKKRCFKYDLEDADPQPAFVRVQCEKVTLHSKRTGRAHYFNCFLDQQLCIPYKFQTQLVPQSSDEDKDTDDETRRQCTEYVFDNLKSGLEHERPSFDASRYKLKKLK